MAPRKTVKIDEDSDLSSISTSNITSPLKPKNEKSKVVKAKAEKAPKIKKEATFKKEKENNVEIGKKDRGGEKEGNSTIKGGKEGKEKTLTVNGDEATELILKYLKEQNRPYSATEVSANLKGKVTKTVTDKLLKELGEASLVASKATKGHEKGSQWVFWALQSPSDNASPAELSLMDTEIQTFKESLPLLKTNLKLATKRWETMKNAPTMRELREGIEEMQRQAKEKGERLRKLREGGEEGRVTVEMVQKVTSEWTFWQGKRARRMKAYRALEDLIVDGMEGLTREDFREEIGFEEDPHV